MPQVRAPYMTTFCPGARPVTPSPSAATSPEASAPTTSGSLRLAKAMPRKPHTSMWLRPTARTRICTSPGDRRRGGSAAANLQVAVAEQLKRAHHRVPLIATCLAASSPIAGA